MMNLVRAAGLAAATVMGLALAGCSDPQSAADPGAYQSGSPEAAAAELLKTMTLEQKVGQMIQGEISEVTPEDVRRYGLGSVLNGGGATVASTTLAQKIAGSGIVSAAAVPLTTSAIVLLLLTLLSGSASSSSRR